MGTVMCVVKGMMLKFVCNNNMTTKRNVQQRHCYGRCVWMLSIDQRLSHHTSKTQASGTY